MAIQMIQKHCESVIRGNWDDFFPKPRKSDSIKWHQSQLTKKQMDYLKELPFSVEFIMSGKLVRMFHASPRSVYERIQPWDSLDRRSVCSKTQKSTENIAGKREPRCHFVRGDVHNPLATKI